jgi:hypothetical protein
MPLTFAGGALDDGGSYTPMPDVAQRSPGRFSLLAVPTAPAMAFPLAWVGAHDPHDVAPAPVVKAAAARPPMISAWRGLRW